MYDAFSKAQSEGKLTEEARAKKLSKQVPGTALGYDDDGGFGGYNGYRGNFSFSPAFHSTKNSTKSTHLNTLNNMLSFPHIHSKLVRSQNYNGIIRI